MLKWLSCVSLLVLAATSARAQDCTIGVYGDAAGTTRAEYEWHFLDGGSTTVVMYVVIFTESDIAAASYRLLVPDLGSTTFFMEVLGGPDGLGLRHTESTGVSVEFTECAFGSGGAPVLVDRYTVLFVPGADWYSFRADIQPNTSQHPELPVYVTCNDEVRTCVPLAPVYASLDPPATSFSHVKSLFGSD